MTLNSGFPWMVLQQSRVNVNFSSIRILVGLLTRLSSSQYTAVFILRFSSFCELCWSLWDGFLSPLSRLHMHLELHEAMGSKSLLTIWSSWHVGGVFCWPDKWLPIYARAYLYRLYSTHVSSSTLRFARAVSRSWGRPMSHCRVWLYCTRISYKMCSGRPLASDRASNASLRPSRYPVFIDFARILYQFWVRTHSFLSDFVVSIDILVIIGSSKQLWLFMSQVHRPYQGGLSLLQRHHCYYVLCRGHSCWRHSMLSSDLPGMHSLRQSDLQISAVGLRRSDSPANLDTVHSR